MPLFIDGPNGRNQYGMRCADYAVIDKSEKKQTGEFHGTSKEDSP